MGLSQSCDYYTIYSKNNKLIKDIAFGIKLMQLIVEFTLLSESL